MFVRNILDCLMTRRVGGKYTFHGHMIDIRNAGRNKTTIEAEYINRVRSNFSDGIVNWDKL